MSSQLTIKLSSRQYHIEIEPGLVNSSSALKSLTSDRAVFIISNKTVADFYLKSIQSQLIEQAPVYLMPDGEQFKNLQQFEKINSELMKLNLGRDSIIIALGGGVVGDLSGFVAACYQRGIEFIQIPTTLLAQIDASVGGKTAVNHSLGKNMIGAFHQPSLVIIDPLTLQSLPEREFNAGMAEAIKYGVMADSNLFGWIEQNAELLKAKDQLILQQLIYKCCAIKAQIVIEDEKERGRRALLNLGHTYGHAFEAETQYLTYLHGEAVAIGMHAAMKLSMLMGDSNQQQLERLLGLLDRFNLPTTIPQNLASNKLIPHMQKDKKNKRGIIHLVVNQGIGQARVIPLDDHDLISKAFPYEK